MDLSCRVKDLFVLIFHNWAAREGTIVRVRGMLKGEVHLKYPDTFFACLKDDFIKLSLKTVCSPNSCIQ